MPLPESIPGVVHVEVLRGAAATADAVSGTEPRSPLQVSSF